jgi:maltose O-acetyltransferase
MNTQRQKMLAGELYDPLDPELVAARQRARDLCQALNAARESEQDERRHILQKLFGAGGDSVWMQPPFFCDYGSNIEPGECVFFNLNCVVLDVCLLLGRHRDRFAVVEIRQSHQAPANVC